MNYLPFVKRVFNPHVKTMWRDTFGKKDPNEFKPNGSQVYHGYQGEGKTLSMVYHGLYKVKPRYPRVLIVTNLHLRDYKPVKVKTRQELDDLMESDEFKSFKFQQENYLLFEKYEELILLLKFARNGKYGVHFMIDEIHQYFHSHDSKSMPVWVVQVFSQQRKQFLLITATVQVWDNVIKALREQIDNLIGCSRYGWLISQTVIDPRDFESNYGEREAQIKKKAFFFMTDDVRNSFDTLQLIESGREIMGMGDTSMIMKSPTTSKNRTNFVKLNEQKYGRR